MSVTKESTRSTRKIKNKILAMPAKPLATLPKPSSAAIRATTKNTTVQ